MKRIFPILIMVAASLAGCSIPSETETHSRIEFASEIATPNERSRCEAAQGQVRRAGVLQHEHCIQNYADAGHRCTDSAQCLGRCVLPADEVAVVGEATVTGRCESDDSPFGCFQEVEDGLTLPAICVD